MLTNMTYQDIDLYIHVGLTNNVNTELFQQEFISKNADATYICVLIFYLFLHLASTYYMNHHNKHQQKGHHHARKYKHRDLKS